MKKNIVRQRRGCLAWMILAGIIFMLPVLVIATAMISPELAAQGSDTLRNIIGDKPVAQLESIVFEIQDEFRQWRYVEGGAAPSAPWSANGPESVKGLIAITPTAPLPSTPVPASTEIVSAPQASFTAQPLPTAWMPVPVPALGSLSGEGVWEPYIQDGSGETVAYRTFLQPDPTRSYAVVGVVAFDASRTRLHYMLGSVEPYSADSPKRTGQMPSQDKMPGILIAMFNGGFKARHGHYGAMADGIVALPPRPDLGTIAIYKDGRILLGEWGSEVDASPQLIAWRQNGPLVVHDGQINPRIYDDSPLDWGYTVDDVSPTWRSGIGLSQDGKTLYYLCGPSLSMEMLAKAMLAAGIQNGMQLDINNYWVHFVAVRDKDNSLSLEPLFPEAMGENVDRYLHPYTRDYFYVTVNR